MNFTFPHYVTTSLFLYREILLSASASPKLSEVLSKLCRQVEHLDSIISLFNTSKIDVFNAGGEISL